MVIVNVLMIDKRKRILKKEIDRVVKQIAEKFKSEKIILFGSYAHGNLHPESNVDLLIVMKSPKSSLEIRRYLGVMFGMVLLIYTPKRLKDRAEMGTGSFATSPKREKCCMKLVVIQDHPAGLAR